MESRGCWIRGRVRWEDLVQGAEKIRGERWEKWEERHGDCGRDGVMYVAVRYGGLRLAEVAREVEMKYHSAAQAVKRFEQMLADNREQDRFVLKLRNQIPTI